MFDEDSSILTDFATQSDVMLIAFSGIFGGYGRMPVFELSRTLARFSVKKIFLRDLEQACYQQGLPGIGESIDTVAAFLRDRIKQQDAQRVIALEPVMHF